MAPATARRLIKKAFLLLLLASLAVACGRDRSAQPVGDLVVRLKAEPNPPRVGEIVLEATITDRGGKAVAPAEVHFHYYPFVHRVKDSLASPDEVVRVAAAATSGDTYRATVTFDKPGPWKVTVRITRLLQPDAMATFTFEARG